MKTIILLVSLVSICHGGKSQLPALMRQRLDSIAVQDVPPGAPGIATAVILKGKVVYQRLAGYARLDDSSLIKPDTRFNIASNGKQFTALAILMLAKEGKLQLNDDIRKYWPGFYKKIPEAITIRHLLTHTSGIRDVYDLLALQGVTWWKQDLDNKALMELIARQQALNFPAGSRYSYSNTNYIILAELIEKISGKSFVAFTNSMFRRLGMNHTSFEDQEQPIRGHIALAYFNFNSWTSFDWKWRGCGDGNLFSTLSDLIHWEQLIQGRKRSGINAALINASQQLVDSTISKQYGYGLEFGLYKGFAYRFHEGATGAWKATVVRFPTEALAIITLTNTGKSIPSMQTRQMADVLLPVKDVQAQFISRPPIRGYYLHEDSIPGIYITPDHFYFQFIRRDGSLFLRREGRGDIRIERESGHVFRQVNDTSFKQSFQMNENGEMEVTAYHTSHGPYTLTRPKSNWKAFSFTSINGDYKNSELDITIRIEYLGGKEYSVLFAGRDSASGILVKPGLMLVNGYALKFTREEGKNVLYLDGNRIGNVQFRSM